MKKYKIFPNPKNTYTSNTGKTLAVILHIPDSALLVDLLGREAVEGIWSEEEGVSSTSMLFSSLELDSGAGCSRLMADISPDSLGFTSEELEDISGGAEEAAADATWGQGPSPLLLIKRLANGHRL